MAKLNPEEIPAEMSSEVTGSGQQVNKPGVYVHEATGKELPALYLQQADAYVQVGFVWKRELTDEDITPASALEILKADQAENAE